jgi:hypothetical protein
VCVYGVVYWTASPTQSSYPHRCTCVRACARWDLHPGKELLALGEELLVLCTVGAGPVCGWAKTLLLCSRMSRTLLVKSARWRGSAAGPFTILSTGRELRIRAVKFRVFSQLICDRRQERVQSSSPKFT